MCHLLYLYSLRTTTDKTQLKTSSYVVLYLDVLTSGGLRDVSICGFDYFETCGVVDKSSSLSRWAIVAEVYSVNSTSECIFQKLILLVIF